jgi:hypothetical protein
VPRFNVPRLVKIYDPAAQFDRQPVARNHKLNDVTMFVHLRRLRATLPLYFIESVINQ